MLSWDKIPGKDNEVLIEFLTKKFDIDWIKTVKIEKTMMVRPHKVSTENKKNSLSLKLNNKN